MNTEVKNWLIKAFNDYKTIMKLIDCPEEEIVTDSVCFHSEQFFEKTLKAYLVSNDTDFKKNHDLAYLVELCSRLDTEFEELNDIAKNLSKYAVQIRYPDDFYIPTPEEAQVAINQAEKVKKFVIDKLNIDETTLD
jgi:HEPN domain-containing protein